MRLDGQTIQDFSAERNDYVVDLPEGSQSNPVLQALSWDNAAKVVQTDERTNIDGKSFITVTSADGLRLYCGGQKDHHRCLLRSERQLRYWAKARGQNASGTETEGLHGKHSSLGGPSHTVMTHLGTSIISVASLVGTLVLTSFGALFGRRYQSSKR